MRDENIYVLGHKNPDTDSICSAISYSYLKNQITGSNRYVPMRAGQMNAESEFVLKYFGVEAPGYMPNVGVQVKDLTIEETEGAPDNVTLRIAWEYMKESGVTSLPMMDKDGKLDGIITVSDVSNYFMDPYSKTMLSEAKTKFYDVAETVNGTVMVGNEHNRFTKGKVFVAASTLEDMERYFEPDDMVIISNREDMQLRAIELGASCIVVTLAKDVSETVRQKAEEAGCVVICTYFDTFLTSRLIGQSIPAKYLMQSTDLTTFRLDDYVDDIRNVMAKKRFRSFPILNHAGDYVGMISRRSLLSMARKKIILVDHTEVSQAADNLAQAEIQEIIDHHRVGTVETEGPVYYRAEVVGCSNTIIYSMFKEAGIEIPKHIAGLMFSAICSDTLLYRSPTCTPRDIAAGDALAKIAGIEDKEEYAKKMFRAASDLANKTPNEIIHQDYKKFVFGETILTVGQISSMDVEELDEIAATITPQLEEECGKNGVQMVFFMLTDILTENTKLLCCGKDAPELIEESFGKEVSDGAVMLEKVVSRKKQLIPAFMKALQAT